MKTEQTIAQFLNIKDFPFKIKDNNDSIIYYEDSDGYWGKYEYDAAGNEIYSETAEGHWFKRAYDDQDNLIYYENSFGHIEDKRPKPIIELTLEDIAKLKGVDVSQIRIKE
jgi:hypothetical protein